VALSFCTTTLLLLLLCCYTCSITNLAVVISLPTYCSFPAILTSCSCFFLCFGTSCFRCFCFGHFFYPRLFFTDLFSCCVQQLQELIKHSKQLQIQIRQERENNSKRTREREKERERKIIQTSRLATTKEDKEDKEDKE